MYPAELCVDNTTGIFMQKILLLFLTLSCAVHAMDITQIFQAKRAYLDKLADHAKRDFPPPGHDANSARRELTRRYNAYFKKLHELGQSNESAAVQELIRDLHSLHWLLQQVTAEKRYPAYGDSSFALILRDVLKDNPYSEIIKP